jgi:hypothetical protein
MSDFVDSVAKLAETLGTVLGGPLVPVAVEIGKDVLALIDKSVYIVNATDALELQKIRDDLEPKVMAHADSVIASLHGTE